MSCQSVQVIHGVSECLRESAFTLYLAEFKRHEAALFITEVQLIRLLKVSLDWRFAFVAVEGDKVIGLAGYQSKSGSFTGAATPFQLLKCLGVRTFFSLSRSPMAGYRKAQCQELLHDGLIVSEGYRRQGVAAQLLNALGAYAENQGFMKMRLDVEGQNIGAIALYQKMGYQACQKKANGHWVYRRHFGSKHQWEGMSSEQ